MDAVKPTQLPDALSLRQAMATFATGVTVVTVGGPRPHGMTANSFTSVSLDPPYVLVCVERAATMHSRLNDAGAFAVSVLGADQEHVARYFANRRRPTGGAQFDVVAWHPGVRTGAPLIAGALAHFECELRETYEGGDHTIFLGLLLSLRRGPAGPALLFVNGQFTTAATSTTSATTTAVTSAPASTTSATSASTSASTSATTVADPRSEVLP